MGSAGSGRTPRTHEQLKDAHKKRGKLLEHAREDLKFWKNRARKAEETISTHVYIDKKPDYFFSFTGHLIFRRFYRLNGLTALQAEIIVLLTYTQTFTFPDYKLFQRNRLSIDKIIHQLVDLRYVIKIEAPGKSKVRMRKVWVLTQKGKDIAADYEKYYDKKMDELRAGRLTPFRFEDGAYFRRVYITRRERRAAQGGGMLPKQVPHREKWRDMEVENEKT